jgi:Fe2+ or Zn2+ uptake regulation protein
LATTTIVERHDVEDLECRYMTAQHHQHHFLACSVFGRSFISVSQAGVCTDQLL